MNRAALAVLKHQKAKHYVGLALSRRANDVLNHRLQWIRGTWFTPPYNANLKLPTNLYMHNPRNLMDDLLRAKYPAEGSSGGNCDAFEWAQRGDKWYNHITKQTLAKSPYSN